MYRSLLLHAPLPPPMSEANTHRLNWSRLLALRTLHEATLQALLGARNYAVLQLLKERNDLLLERYLTLAPFFVAASFLTLAFHSLTGECHLAVPVYYSQTRTSSRQVTPRLCCLT